MLHPGDTAPQFKLKTADGSEIALSDLKGKAVVLYAYPKAMTPGCTTQACDFRDSKTVWEREGFVVLGLSPDTPAELAEFTEHDQLTFPLLSDPDKSVLKAYGAYGDKMNYGKVVQGVIRSTFVIDVDAAGNAKIRLAQYNVKATGHVAKLRRDLGID